MSHTEHRSGDLSQNVSEMDADPAAAATGHTKDVNNIDPYILVKDAYKGTGGFRTGEYLKEHSREKDFNERKGFSYYLNYFKPILDALVNPVFKRPPERDSGKSNKYQEFEKDCDRNGTSLNKFMRRGAKKGKRDGVAFVVMDNVKEQPPNQKEAMEKRAFPYVYIKEAAKVKHYEVDKFGKLLSIAFEEKADNIEKDKDGKIQYRQWTPGKWEVFKKYDKEHGFTESIESGTVPNNLLSVIPLFFAEQDEDEYLPHPPLYDIARLNAAIYNVCSELREVQRRQGFSILAIPRTGGGQSPGKSKAIGTKSGLSYPAEAKVGPHFIQPDVSIQEGYMKERDKLTEEIYKQAKLAGVTGVLKESGIAKQWDFEATDVELSEVARICEDGEKNVAGSFMTWIAESFEFEIAYAEAFGVFDIDADIRRAEEFIALGLTPEVVRKAKKMVVTNYFKSLEPKERDELADTIDKMSVDELEQKFNDLKEKLKKLNDESGEE